MYNLSCNVSEMLKNTDCSVTTRPTIVYKQMYMYMCSRLRVIFGRYTRVVKLNLVPASSALANRLKV
jgi:hypothetical protein